MAKKTSFLELPPNTEVDLVAIKGTQATTMKNITLHEANMKITEFKKDPKWKKWRFQIFQKGFSQYNNNQS